MTSENPNENMSLSERLAKWFDSPEGQASLANMKAEHEREERAKERFSNRIKSMSLKEQDEWMEKIIARYSSKEYSDYWYDRGIFPPCWLYNKIFEFISENGIIVDEINDEWSKSPVWQYNHWKVDAVYGQGETHYNFVKTLDEAHPYGDNIFYAIRAKIGISAIDSVLCKSWNDAKSVVEHFVTVCNNKNISISEESFDIVEIEVKSVQETVEELDSLINESTIIA